MVYLMPLNNGMNIIKVATSNKQSISFYLMKIPERLSCTYIHTQLYFIKPISYNTSILNSFAELFINSFTIIFLSNISMLIKFV